MRKKRQKVKILRTTDKETIKKIMGAEEVEAKEELDKTREEEVNEEDSKTEITKVSTMISIKTIMKDHSEKVISHSTITEEAKTSKAEETKEETSEVVVEEEVTETTSSIKTMNLYESMSTQQKTQFKKISKMITLTISQYLSTNNLERFKPDKKACQLNLLRLFQSTLRNK